MTREAQISRYTFLRTVVGFWSLSGLFAFFFFSAIVRSDPVQSHRRLHTSDWAKSFPQDVVAHMDLTVDPCDDFYEFSCGAWLYQLEIPDNKSSFSLSFTTVNDENDKVLKEVMGQGWPLIGELYESCMNFSNTSDPVADKASLMALAPGLQRISAATTKEGLFHLAGNLSRAGPVFLTGLGVSADARAATTYALYVSQTGLSLPDREYYLDKKKYASIRDDFHTYISTLFRLVGLNPDSADALAVAVSRFEKKLAEFHVPKEDLQDPLATYNRMSAAKAVRLYPLLFSQYVDGNGILKGLLANKTDVIVETPTYFQHVEELVASESVTLDVLKAVLQYQYIHAEAGLLSAPYYHASFSFFGQKLHGQKTPVERWRKCVDHVASSFPELVGKYYTLARFDKESEKAASDLVTQIQVSLKHELGQLDWLDASTRKAALDKLKKMANLIGHSTHSEHFTFQLRSDVSLLENSRIISEYEFAKHVARIGGPVDRTEWAMTSATANAYYEMTANQIVLPAGILQSPFFSRSRHPARNFGSIGSVIGHELTHGFDAQGRYYAGDGNLQDWWSNDTAKEFEKRTDCLVAQYDKYEMPSYFTKNKILGHVNGNYTLSENIADNGGVKLAFAAYHASMNSGAKQSSENEEKLAGNAADQLFFVSFAQTFCSKSRDASIINQLASDPHTPGRWRINGVASNSRDFAKVFMCPAGSPMNPKTKCQLW
ncbi:putative peptidase M13, metallopeptidase, catalytic domain superfamily [Plasmopara halstedii]